MSRLGALSSTLLISRLVFVFQGLSTSPLKISAVSDRYTVVFSAINLVSVSELDRGEISWNLSLNKNVVHAVHEAH